MSSQFLPDISREKLHTAFNSGNYAELYDLLSQPLHEELYKRKTFDFLDDLSAGQQMLLVYDYIRTQVLQGGFIQFIENGYIGLLPAMVTQLNAIGGTAMAEVLDDVLKVYVLNSEQLSKPTTVEEFAKLYDEFKEFEVIDQRFGKYNEETMTRMLDHAMTNLSDYIANP